MDLFCPAAEADAAADGLCELEVLTVLLGGGFAYFAVIAIVYLHFSKVYRRKQTREKWCGHAARGAASVLLLGALAGAGAARHGAGSAAAALAGWLAGLALHRMLERRRLPAALIFLAAYSALAAAAAAGRVACLLRDGARWHHVVVPIHACLAALYGWLFVNDCVAAYVEIRKSTRSYTVKNKQQQSDSKTKIAYDHASASIYSQLTFYWLRSLLWFGFRNPLEFEDLGILPEEENSSSQFASFKKIYNCEIKNATAENGTLSLWRCYLKSIYPNFYIGGVYKFLGDAVGLAGPLGLSVIINYAALITADDADAGKINSKYLTITEYFSNGYVMGVVVLFSSLAQGTLSQAATHLVTVEGVRLRTALQSLIYDKCLRLTAWSSEERGDDESSGLLSASSDNDCDSLGNRSAHANSGLITNLITEDTYNVMSFVWMGHYVWAIPLKITVLLYLLYMKLGISAIVGTFLCILTMTPLQFMIGKKMSTNSKHVSERTDVRMTKINEILQGMKLIKLYGWESLYQEKILNLREIELQLLNKDSVYWALLSFVTHASLILITLSTFCLYFIFEEDHLTAANVFAGLALFNQLTVPLLIFPVTVPIIISAMVSTRRLENFLQLPETSKAIADVGGECVKHEKLKRGDASADVSLGDMELSGYNAVLHNIAEVEDENDDDNDETEEDTSVDEVDASIKEGSNLVTIKDAVFRWGDDRDYAASLEIDDLQIPAGKLTVIVGDSGSGKSSLLSALIGEMNLEKGKVAWTGSYSVAYAAQEPWILNATLRENILFGEPWQLQRYNGVIRACCLRPDIQLLPELDLTVLGTRGIELSGGQRARVATARALYSRAQLVLLDAPLAALDHRVARRVFERGLLALGRARRRTVVCAITRLPTLQYADMIVAMEDCRIQAAGSMQELARQAPRLVAGWKADMARETEDEPHYAASTTARERWQLLRHVNRIGLQLRCRDESWGQETVWTSEDDSEALSGSMRSIRRRQTALHGCWATEWTGEDSLSALGGSLGRRSTRRRRSRRPLARQLSSPVTPQAPHFPAHALRRQRSNPTETAHQQSLFRQLLSMSSHKVIGSHALARDSSFIKRLFTSAPNNVRTQWRVNKDQTHQPIKRLISTNSTLSGDFMEDDLEEGIEEDKHIPNDDREYGTISQRVYWEYMKSCGYVVSLLYLLSALLWQAVRVATDFWLNKWTNQGDTTSVHPFSKNEMIKYLTVYVVLCSISVLFSLAASALGQLASARARRRLHGRLLSTVLRLPLRFFETTPVGRSINRFGGDMAIIDKKIAISIQRLLQFVFLCGSAILVNAVITPWFLLISLPICFIYYVIQKIYRTTTRELQRLDALSQNPIVSHYAETMQGLATIRACEQHSRFRHSLFSKMDVNINAFLLLNASHRWLGVALDFLGAIILFLSIITSLVTAQMYPKVVTPSLVGLAINYMMLVPIYLNWVVKFLSDMEMYMGAVERVHQYTLLPTEDYRENAEGVTKSWPDRGDIVFEHVSARYGSDGPPILHDINITIPAGQKVAICGRSGSGKSTLLLCVSAAPLACSGRVLVDGVDVASAPLHALRRRMHHAPQPHALLAGTLRDNLDPLAVHADEEIWRCLEMAHLKEFVASQPGGLDCSVSCGGGRWSTGERARASCARAALGAESAAALLLDEPPAAFDALRAAGDRTLLTVAHRVSSVMSYERVLVLEAGRILEDDTPARLAARPDSAFARLLRAAHDA